MESGPEHLFGDITRVLKENLLVEVDSDEQDLLVSGALDSLTLVQLMLALEQRFSITIPLERLEIDDFRSVASIAQLVHKRLQEARASASYPTLSLSIDEVSGHARPALAVPAAEGGKGRS